MTEEAQYLLDTIVSLLVDKDCRLTNYDQETWLTATDTGGDITYSVYCRKRGARYSQTLYEGANLLTALEFMKG